MKDTYVIFGQPIEVIENIHGLNRFVASMLSGKGIFGAGKTRDEALYQCIRTWYSLSNLDGVPRPVPLPTGKTVAQLEQETRDK